VTTARRWLVVAAAAALFVAGCQGYSMQPLHRTDVKTVSVQIFGSKEFRRELEFDLTGKLARLIEQRTPYKIVHDPKRADTELRGEITVLQAPVMSENTSTNLPQDITITVTCWFEWKDLRTGEVLTRREKISGSSSYAPAIGQNLNSGTNDAMIRLAEHIVEAMESDW
jgi:hypothetical protein